MNRTTRTLIGVAIYAFYGYSHSALRARER